MTLIFGVHIWPGPLLNSVIALLAVVSLARFAAQILKDRKETLLVVLTFALNPSVLLVPLEVRQYALLSLWTVLFVWQTIQYAESHVQHRRLAIIGVLIVLGLLTHHQFLIVMFGGILVVAVRRWGTNRWQVGLFLLCSVLACFAAYAIHPYFFHALRQQQSANPQRGLAQWSNRLGNVLTALIAYSYLVPAFIASLVLLWRKARRRSKTIIEQLMSVERRGVSVLFFALWTTGAVIAQYLAFLSPEHAMGPPKYFAIAWPFLSILTLYALRMADYRRSLLLYLTAIPILLASLFPLEMRIYDTSNMRPILNQSELNIVDNPDRGIFLQVAWFLPDDLSVIVDAQEDLLENAKQWLPLLEEGGLYSPFA